MTAPYAPAFSNPSAQGMLSNKRGSNTGADAISNTVTYRNPRGTSAPAGGIRVNATRIGLSGNPSGPETAWDSGRVGTPPVSAMSKGAAAMGQPYVYKGRVYVVNNQGVVQSAPVTGAAIGTWRYELSCPVAVIVSPSDATTVGITGINGFLYVLDGLFQVWMSTISAVGTLSAWKQLTTSSSGSESSGILAYATAAGVPYLLTMAPNATPVGTYYPINADGTLGTGTGSTVPAGSWTVAGNLFWSAAANKVGWVGGGLSGSTAGFYAVINSNGSIGSWSTSGTTLPAARREGAVIADGRSTEYIWYVGGSTNGTSAVDTIYYVAASTFFSASAVVWTTSGKVYSGAHTLLLVTPAHYTPNNTPYLVFIGGDTMNIASITSATTVKGAPMSASFGSDLGALVTGTQTLASASLGTGASKTDNLDGSQSWTYLYAAFGAAAAITAFNDGDLVQIAVDFIDQNGDPSVGSAITIIKIGQAPTISNAAVGSGGQPTASFNYNPGAGGGAEDSYRVTVGGAPLYLFDSGTRKDQANSIQLRQAPQFPNGVLQTATITVTASDTPMPGSSASASTTVNFTPSYVGPGVPTAVSAVANHATGSVTISWTNPTGAVTARIYYRRTGTALWYILQDLVAVSASAQSITVIDELALGIQYDFAVGIINSAGEGSASSPTILNPDVEAQPAAQNTQALFRSIGTDATGTLNAWSQALGSWSIASNVAAVTNAASADAVMVAGHADWTDCTALVRVKCPAVNGEISVGLHYVDLGDYIYAGLSTTYFSLNKKVGNNTLSVTSQSQTFTAGTFYWLKIIASGSTYSVLAFADSAGAAGSQIGTTITATVSDVSSIGRLVLKAFNGSGSPITFNFGGAFAGVCQVVGPAPYQWTTSFQAGEPAFAWSKVSPYTGTYSVSIYNAHSTGNGQWASWDAIPFVLANTGYSHVGYLKTVGCSGTGAQLFVNEETSGIVYIRSDLSAAVTGTTPWAQVSYSFTTSGTCALLQAGFLLQGVGTAYMDLVGLNLSGMTGIKIDQVAGGYAGMLHVAGKGTTYQAALAIEGPPKIATRLDVETLELLGISAPAARYGLLDYHQLEVKAFVKDVATLKILQTMIAQALLGQSLYYRDGFGTMLVCALQPEQDVEYVQPGARYATLRLTEVGNQYSPSTSQGNATGFRQQVNGTLVPLDTAELAL